MEDRSNEPLSELIQYIQQWLAANEANQQAVKPLTDILEVCKWAQETISSMPAALKATFDDSSFRTSIDRTRLWLIGIAPPIQPVNFYAIASTSASSTGITSNLLFELSGNATTPGDKSWVADRTSLFAHLQERHQNIEKARELLAKLDTRIPEPPMLAEEYDLMVEKAFYYRGTDLDKTISAGIALRNVHEHYKGKVMALARAFPKENMTFELALTRL